MFLRMVGESALRTQFPSKTRMINKIRNVRIKKLSDSLHCIQGTCIALYFSRRQNCTVSNLKAFTDNNYNKAQMISIRF